MYVIYFRGGESLLHVFILIPCSCLFIAFMFCQSYLFIAFPSRRNHQLRARRALSIFKDVLLRTRRALSLYKVYGDKGLLVLNGKSLNSNSALLALNCRNAHLYIGIRRYVHPPLHPIHVGPCRHKVMISFNRGS